MLRVRRLLIPALLVSLALLAAACGDSAGDDASPAPSATDGAAAASADLDEGVAAVVNGEEIETTAVRSQVEAAAESPQLSQQLDGPQGELVRSQLRAQILSQLILSEIILQEGDERGIEVSEQAVTEKRSELEEQAGGADAFADSIEQAGMTDVELQRQLRIAVIVDRIEAGLDVEGGDTPAPAPTSSAAPAPDPTQQALAREIQGLIREAEVTVDVEFGSWNARQGQVVPPQPETPVQPPPAGTPSSAPPAAPTPAPSGSE